MIYAIKKVTQLRMQQCRNSLIYVGPHVSNEGRFLFLTLFMLFLGGCCDLSNQKSNTTADTTVSKRLDDVGPYVSKAPDTIMSGVKTPNPTLTAYFQSFSSCTPSTTLCNSQLENLTMFIKWLRAQLCLKLCS